MADFDKFTARQEKLRGNVMRDRLYNPKKFQDGEAKMDQILSKMAIYTLAIEILDEQIMDKWRKYIDRSKHRIVLLKEAKDALLNADYSKETQNKIQEDIDKLIDDQELFAKAVDLLKEKQYNILKKGLMKANLMRMKYQYERIRERLYSGFYN